MSDERHQPRQERIGNWQEEFVGQLYRLFKLSRIHDLENEAAQQGLETTAHQFQELLALEGIDYLDVVFAGDNIFINGKPLRASREVYHTVLDLGELLKEVDFNEVTLTPGVDQQALEAMLREYNRRREHPGQRDKRVVRPAESIRYRLIDPKKLLDIEEEEEQTAEEQVLQLYPAAVVTMRRFHQAVQQQEFRGLRFIKRISQRLVALSDSAAETFLAMTSMRKTRDDKGGISVNAGVLAMLVGRHITDSYRTLQRLCYSAMVADIGRPRAAGVYDRREVPNVIPKLSMSGKESLGPSNALLILRNGRLREPTLRRATIAYEAGWLRYEHDIGWPYGNNRRPSVESFIVRVCHRYWDLMALKPSMNERRSPEQVFETLLEEADSRLERAVVRLVMETLAFYERGAIVETSEGWKGVVVEPGERMADFPRPVVRMVRDASGNAIDPQDLDLSNADIDFERFGLVRRQIRNVKDERLLKVARRIRPDDWDQKHATPSKKSRKRRTPRKKSKPASNRSSPERKDSDPPSTPTESDQSPGSGHSTGRSSGAHRAGGQGGNSDASSSSRPASGTSQSLKARRRESTEKSSPEDPSVVLEFGPGSGPPGAGAAQGPSGEPEAPGQGTEGNEADEQVPELSPEAIEPTDEEGGDDEIADISPDQIDPVEQPSDAAAAGDDPEPASDAQDPTRQMSREEADRKLGDFVEREQQRGEQNDDGMLRDYIDSVQDEQADPDPDRQPASEPRARQQFEPEELSGQTGVDADPGGSGAEATPDDATRQMDSEQSANVLEDFVDETSGEQAPPGDGATRQVDAEQSHQMLEDYVDQPDEPDDSRGEEDGGRLGSLATDMSEDTSPEEISKTERVSSEKSHELLRDFVQEDDADEAHATDSASSDVEQAATEAIDHEQSEELLQDFVDETAGGAESSGSDREHSGRISPPGDRDPDTPDSGATEAMSSEKSRELLDSYVDEPSGQADPHDSGGVDEEGRLGQLASDIDEAPDQKQDAKTVANDESHELMRDFVEETPASEGGDADAEQGDKHLGEMVAEQLQESEAEPEDGSTEAISSEKSRELLRDFVDSEQEESAEDDDATRRVSSEHSAQVLQDFVDDEDDS